MNKIFKIFMCAAVAMTSLTTVAADPYKVRVMLSEDEDGAMVYLYNYDTVTKIDSVLVTEKEAVFTGEIDEPVLAVFSIDGRSSAPFVLESGSIVYDKNKHKVFGSMLNDQMAEYNGKVEELSKKMRAAQSEAEGEAIFNQYIEMTQSSMAENVDNPLGLYYFLQFSSYLNPDEFFALTTKYPSLKAYNRVANAIAIQEKKLATAPGKKFVDFEVVYDGKTERLSDYVGKGKYVLVDYWASWCGPCIRQIPVIKELLAEFGDKGLEVLGVAVWDEPANTIKAIESHGIIWPCIINAQSIPTDLYGIQGIPCIILYGPDGTILSRDKQGDDLKADVRAAFAGTLKID